ncbi:hypothetical protein FLP41_04530 [Paracoccus marcusii]|nr:hypothetical protein FLP41_04530 [Paracoccus marcusii]
MWLPLLVGLMAALFSAYVVVLLDLGPLAACAAAAPTGRARCG